MVTILKLIIILSFILIFLLNIYVALKIHMIRKERKEIEYYINEAKKIIEKEK